MMLGMTTPHPPRPATGPPAESDRVFPVRDGDVFDIVDVNGCPILKLHIEDGRLQAEYADEDLDEAARTFVSYLRTVYVQQLINRADLDRISIQRFGRPIRVPEGGPRFQDEIPGRGQTRAHSGEPSPVHDSGPYQDEDQALRQYMATAYGIPGGYTAHLLEAVLRARI